MAIGDNVITAYGISWTLRVQEFAVFFYDHPQFGYLAYTGRKAWKCDRPNTVHLTSQGTLPDGVLPPTICIKPKHECYDPVDECGYETAEARCACADPCCDCLPGFISLTCSGVTVTCSSSYCIGGRTGVESPAGVSREMCCTMNLGGTDYEICVVIYCQAGGTWKSDWYCDSVFCETHDIEISSRCPITGSGPGTVCCPGLDCTACTGINTECEPPEPPDEECCPCDDLPATASMTDGLGNTLNMNKADCASFPGGSYVASPGTFCGEGIVNADVRCEDGEWILSGFFPDATLTKSGDCAALILTGTWGGCSVTVTI